MKTLLVYSPCGSYNQTFHMPLGICALKSYLEKNGYKANAIDLNIKTFLENENKNLWDGKYPMDWFIEKSFYKKVLPLLDIEKMLNHLLSFDADIIGFSINLASIHISLILAEQIKKTTDKKVVFGGVGCYEGGIEKYFQAGVDAVVIGEGEGALLELVQDFNLCQGVYMLQNDKIVYGGDREPINIDNLPFHNFDDIIDDYRTLNPDAYVSFNFLRGCPNRCVFCDESAFWKKVRQRSPENIINELIHIKSKYNVKGFFKADSTLTVSADVLDRICDLMIENNLNLVWGSQARPEKWLTPERLKKMYKAGYRYSLYGAESGSQKIIEKMKKNFDLKDVERVIRDTKNAGIDVTISLILDSPGETLLDYIKTIMFVLRTKKYVSVFSPNKANLPPRSEWYGNPSKYSIVVKHFYKWHSKNYMNNPYSAGIKMFILNLILIIIGRTSRRTFL
jgi:radical SAM superfamily enzyme YgiQ (UPF0313 family)